MGFYDPWTGSLNDGWRQLTDRLERGFPSRVLEETVHGVFGASLAYWATADHGVDPNAYAEDACAILGFREGEWPRCAETDLGPLWENDAPQSCGRPQLFLDRWVLVARPDKDDDVSGRYFEPLLTGPPDFAMVALARHKFHFHLREYEQFKPYLEYLERGIEWRTEWMIGTQRHHGRHLGDLRGGTSLRFQKKLTGASTNLADYRSSLTRAQELRHTLDINRTNFLTKCAGLLSAGGPEEIASAEYHERAALSFLTTRKAEPGEGIFLRELGRMRWACQQLDADLAYADRTVERHTAALDAGTEQLQIAGERELGEMRHHLAIDSAAVVASLAAFVAVEQLFKPFHLEGTPLGIAGTLLVAWTCFVAVLWLGGGHAVDRLKRTGAVLTVGLLALTGSMWLSPAYQQQHAGPLEVMVVPVSGEPVVFSDHDQGLATLLRYGFALAGAAAAGLLLLAHSRRMARRSLPDPHSTRGPHSRRLLRQRLLHASPELADLLDDLPPSTEYPVRDKYVLRAKLVRKNGAEAARRGVTLAHIPQNEHYTLGDLNNAIGIRYVVAPWRVAEVVERVTAVTQPAAIYCAFSDRSLVFDIDQWGTGPRRDVNLLAEAQVRTFLQDAAASWIASRLHRDARHIRGADASGLDRMVIGALGRLIGVEFWLFLSRMDWSSGQED